jgi:hypothetical protein
MKRFLIFAAVAPPVGFIVAFWVMLQIANWLAGSPATFDVAQIMMLPTIYLIGMTPALLAVVRPYAGKAQRRLPHRAYGAVWLRDQLSAACSRVLDRVRP